MCGTPRDFEPGILVMTIVNIKEMYEVTATKGLISSNIAKECYPSKGKGQARYEQSAEQEKIVRMWQPLKFPYQEVFCKTLARGL